MGSSEIGKKSWTEVAERCAGQNDAPQEDILFIEEELKKEKTDIPVALSEEVFFDEKKGSTEDRKKEGASEDARTLLKDANLPAKIKLAMFGNSVCRELLIRDSNKMIQEFVLKNPRIQQKEVEDFARNPNISQHVLRRISENSTWTRSYTLKVNLTSNPKTPGDVALKWLRHLNVSEIRKLARSKNIPQVVAVMARKRLADLDKH